MPIRPCMWLKKQDGIGFISTLIQPSQKHEWLLRMETAIRDQAHLPPERDGRAFGDSLTFPDWVPRLVVGDFGEKAVNLGERELKVEVG
jgi:hypothetical protein